jgi:hypothetical protein
MNTQNIPLNDIRIDCGTQARTGLNDATVAEYADALLTGAEFPPAVVFVHEGKVVLVDGFHRFHAHMAAGRVDMSCQVHAGTLRDAVLYAVGANGTHGLRRTRDDKRRAVRMLLEDAEWGQWSDREIAKRCDVTHPFVGALRAELRPKPHLETLPDEPPEVRKFERGGEVHEQRVKQPADTTVAAPRTQPDTAPSEPVVTQPEQEDQGSDIAQLAEELQADVERLQADIKALTADDTKAELLRVRRQLDHAQRQQSEAMDRAKQATDRESWVMRQLRRCGKAVKEEDPTRIAAAVEAMARDGGMKEAA